MAGTGKPPGEHRRRRSKGSKKRAKPTFIRPREWVQSELQGVLDWLARLKGPEGEKYPDGWRMGQIRHYRDRAKKLRAEIKAHKRRDQRKETGSDPGPTAA